MSQHVPPNTEAKTASQNSYAQALIAHAAQLGACRSIDAIINTACHMAHTILNIPIALIGLYDPSNDQIISQGGIGVPAEVLTTLAPWPRVFFDSLIHSNHMVIIPDLQDLSHVPNGPVWQQPRTRTIVVALLHHEDQLLGGLAIATLDAPRTFANNELEFLQGLAHQTTLALANMRRYDSERAARKAAEQARRRLTLLNDVGRMISSTFNGKDTLPAVFARISQELADGCLLDQLPTENQERRIIAVSSQIRQSDVFQHIATTFLNDPLLATTIATMLQTNQAQRIQFDPPFWMHHHPSYQASYHIRSAIIAPIQSHHFLLGLMVLLRFEHSPPFVDDDLQIIDELGQRIAQAIEHEQLFHAALVSEERYRSLVELTADAAAELGIQRDGTHRWLWAHHSNDDQLGYNLADLQAIGSLRSIVALEDRATYQTFIACLLETGESETELRIITRNGEQRWYRLRARKMAETPDGHFRLLGAAHDITYDKQALQERLNLERALYETQKLESLGVLASGIAHDFNNLLAIIRGNVGLASFDLSNDSPIRLFLGQIETAAQRATELTRQILAYAGQGTIEPSPVQISDIVDETLILIRASINRRINLQLQMDHTLPCIYADPSQIRQVVMNLVINAAEAIGERPGTISIHTAVQVVSRSELILAQINPETPPGTYVTLMVRDNGPGIQPQQLHRIFEPFFSTKFTGRGLGLSVVHGIVRRHQGALRVESQPGIATQFTLYFPTVPTTQKDQHPMQPTSTTQWHGDGTILIVDDEPQLLRLTQRLLARLGFTTIGAADPLQALEVIKTETTTIRGVLLDLSMPQMDGIEASHALRQFKPQLPILLMSGYPAESVAHQLSRFGPTSFIQKPFTNDELSATLQQLLEQR